MAINLKCSRADNLWKNPSVIQDVVSLIDQSQVVICDCTGINGNVFYNRGVRNFLDLYQGLANTWVVYDNSFIGNPLFVAEGVGGMITQLRQKDLWSEFCEAKNDRTY